MIGLFAICGGCSTTDRFLQMFVPGEPVTKDRCLSFDMFQMGEKEGLEGVRRGGKFEFWDKDCRAFGVKLSREDYDRGYDQGIKQFCSCEKGFSSGVHDEVLGLKSQYYICEKEAYEDFSRGYTEGQKHLTDKDLVEKKSDIQYIYHDEMIQVRAKAFCESGK